MATATIVPDAKADQSQRSNGDDTLAKGAWFLYEIAEGRAVRVEYLGRISGQHYVTRSFQGGRADGETDVYLAPQSLLACRTWPPAVDQAGTCRVKREIGGRDYWWRVSFTVSEAGRIAVPAGCFRVLRIAVDMSAELDRPTPRSMREVWWYAPRLKWPVKYRFEQAGQDAVLVDFGGLRPSSNGFRDCPSSINADR